MAGIIFVPQTSDKQIGDDTRKIIRRHVMLGKNRGRTQDPKQPTLKGAAVFRSDDWHSPERAQQPVHLAIPRKVGSDLSFLTFADTVKHSLLSDTLRFCVAVTEKLFVLGPCISFDPADSTDRCLQMMAHDALYLNVMVFGAQAYMNSVALQTTSQPRGSRLATSIGHYVKALRLLRERVADIERHEFQISEVTILAILPLTIHALVAGELQAARNHVIGLSRLLRMRDDGVFAFRSRMTHMIEILRCDISVSLATGQPPLFSESSDQMPLPELEDSGTMPQTYITVTNHELAAIFDTLRRFCAIINKAIATGATLQEGLVLGTLASAIYRLLNIIVVPPSSDEAVRLATLAFCASAFVHWPQIQIPSTWLKDEYKHSILRFMHCLDPATVLWLLATYEIAFAQLDEEERKEIQLWLIETTEFHQITSWDGLKVTLSRFLWIDVVHDGPARKFFEGGLTRSHRGPC